MERIAFCGNGMCPNDPSLCDARSVRCRRHRGDLSAGADGTGGERLMMGMNGDATTTASSLARERFREVMARVANPVSIVTTLHEGRPYGTTVSAFTTLSMDPPMVLVALDRGSLTLASIREAKRFGLNILSAGQAQTAAAFATKCGSKKFQTASWNLREGLPRIPGGLGWVTSTLADLVDAGDHVIALGHVQSAATTDGRPLVYHRRTFGTYLPH